MINTLHTGIRKGLSLRYLMMLIAIALKRVSLVYTSHLVPQSVNFSHMYPRGLEW
jgi:hypothetical protein